MRQQGQPAIIAGVILLVVGGVMITFGWDRAAGLDYVQGQFPYLLSASLPGLALIIIGLTILVLAIVRRDAVERDQQLEKLTASIAELASIVGPRDPYDYAVTGEYRPKPRVSANGNGSGPEAVDGDAPTVEISRPGSFEQGK